MSTRLFPVRTGIIRTTTGIEKVGGTTKGTGITKTMIGTTAMLTGITKMTIITAMAMTMITAMAMAGNPVMPVFDSFAG
jgi:hypothetical protein